MSEKELTEDQKRRIEEIKKQWEAEIMPLYDRIDAEEEIRKKNNGPIVLDKHLKEESAIHRKYLAMIRAVANEE